MPGSERVVEAGFRVRRPLRYDDVAHSRRAHVAPDQPAIRQALLKRPDVGSRGAVAALPALDIPWLDVGGSPAVLIVILAIIAVVALLVAVAASGGGSRSRSRRSVEDDSELFTTTPLPVPKEELARMRREPSPYQAFAPLRLPRWVQLGSVVIALGITYVAAQRLRTDEAAKEEHAVAGDSHITPDRADPDDGSPESLDLSPASGHPFSFRSRPFISASGGCVVPLEVAKGAAAAWTLTARIHDDRGQLIDTTTTRVASLREGEVVEFRFRRTPCERIGAWDVGGTRRTR